MGLIELQAYLEVEVFFFLSRLGNLGFCEGVSSSLLLMCTLDHLFTLLLELSNSTGMLVRWKCGGKCGGVGASDRSACLDWWQASVDISVIGRAVVVVVVVVVEVLRLIGAASCSLWAGC